MSKKLMLLIAVVLVAAIGAAFYFMYWIKQPAYSLYLAYDAAKAHDVVKFEKHVNLNSVYGKAIDAIFDKMLNKEHAVRGLSAQLRDNVAEQLAVKTRTAIANDKTKNTQPAAQEQPVKERKQDLLDILNLRAISQEYLQKYMDQRLNFKYMRLKGVSTSEKVGNDIILTGKFHDIQVDKDFELKLKMTALPDGTWQVVELVNVVDVVIERDKAAQQRLAELNKEIQQKMNKIFAVQKVTAEAKMLRKGILPVAEFSYTIDYCLADSKNQANEIVGTFMLKDMNGKVKQEESVTIKNLGSLYTAADYNAKKIYQYTWSKRDSLGVLIGHERGILKKGIENYDGSFVVDKVILKDNSVLEAIDVLPEPKS